MVAVTATTAFSAGRTPCSGTFGAVRAETVTSGTDAGITLGTATGAGAGLMSALAGHGSGTGSVGSEAGGVDGLAATTAGVGLGAGGWTNDAGSPAQFTELGGGCGVGAESALTGDVLGSRPTVGESPSVATCTGGVGRVSLIALLGVLRT